jgi:hypothetical protein
MAAHYGMPFYPGAVKGPMMMMQPMPMGYPGNVPPNLYLMQMMAAANAARMG